MARLLLVIGFDAHHPAELAHFWARVLGREVVADPRGPLLPGSDTQLGLRFAARGTEAADPARRYVHLHVTSESAADQRRTVAAALDLGARHLDVGQLPAEGHVVLADPEGNAFCVIEPGNAFLAGCGLLGEIACEGTRDVGLFWAEALGWPLVWDRDQETAVQSPRGGTKVAWGGPPVPPKSGRNRQWFHLSTVAGDLAPEIERLTALGATVLGGVEDGAGEMADPDGNEFWLASA